MKITKKQLKRIIKEELTHSNIGAGRGPQEVFEAANSALHEAHKDLQMLSLHLKNGGFDIEPTEDLLKAVERTLFGMNDLVKQDVQDLINAGDGGGGEDATNEAHQPWRGKRTMADLDKDAKTRETDFLKKGETGGKRTLKQVGREKREKAGMEPHPRYAKKELQEVTKQSQLKQIIKEEIAKMQHGGNG